MKIFFLIIGSASLATGITLIAQEALVLSMGKYFLLYSAFFMGIFFVLIGLSWELDSIARSALNIDVNTRAPYIKERR